jgi:hypothetical protein
MFIIFFQIPAELGLDIILFPYPAYLRALQPHHYISQPLSTGCSALLYFFQQGSNHQATPSGTAIYPHH